MDRAQTSDRSIKPIIVELPGEGYNSSHSCVPISDWDTSFTVLIIQSIFHYMLISIILVHNEAQLEGLMDSARAQDILEEKVGL